MRWRKWESKKKKSTQEKNNDRNKRKEFNKTLPVTSNSKKITCWSDSVTRKNSTGNKNNDSDPDNEPKLEDCRNKYKRYQKWPHNNSRKKSLSIWLLSEWKQYKNNKWRTSKQSYNKILHFPSNRLLKSRNLRKSKHMLANPLISSKIIIALRIKLFWSYLAIEIIAIIKNK